MRHLRLVILATLLLGSLLVGAPRQASAADPVRDAAAKARDAHAAGEAAALGAMANDHRVDPWLVLEELLATGDGKVAEALAAARRATDAAAMKRYVTWRAAHPVKPELRKALHRWIGRADATALLAELEALPEAGRGVTAVMLLRQRVRLYSTLKMPVEDVVQTMLAEADAAAELGWDTRAFSVYRPAFEQLYHATGTKELLRVGKALIEAATRMGGTYVQADAHICMARALQLAGRAEEGLTHARRAFELAPQPPVKRGAQRLVAVTLMELGYTHEVVRALETLRGLDAALNDRHGQSLTEMRLAGYEAKLGRSAQAVARIESLIEYFEQRGAPVDERAVHVQAASIRRQLQDPRRTLEHVAKARSAEKRALDEGAPQRMEPAQLDKLEALALVSLRRTEEALPLLEGLVKKRTRATPAVRAFDAMSLGTALAQLGKHAAAAEAFTAGAAFLDDNLAADVRAKFHQARAAALLRAGKLDEATVFAQKARAVGEEGLLDEFSASAEGVLARIAYARGDLPATVTYAQAMLALLAKRSAALHARAGAMFRAGFAETARMAIEAAARSGNAARLFEVAEGMAAVGLRSRLGADEVVASALPPELQARELVLQEDEARVVRAVRSAPDAKARREAFAQLKRVREQLDRHRERLHAEQAAAGHVLEPRVDSLGKVQAKLDGDAFVVMYLLGQEHAWALTVTPSAAKIVSLGKRAATLGILQEVVLEDPSTPAGKDVDRLRAAFIKPLALPKRVKQLSIVPSGALSFVPFAALLPKRRVALLPSVTAGRLLATRALSGKGTLAVGDPASGDGRRLPGARKEARQVGDVVLLDKDATEARIRAELAKRTRWRAVHLGCHGLIDPAHPLRSSLSLTPAAGDDGLWTVSELLRDKVSADAVVLGACSTGRGRSFDQDGVLGFVHAFFVAGARHVVVSLWDVEDEPASALLARFHKEWQGEVDAATALAKAQAWLRTETPWKHPAHWAAWQLWGPP